MESSARREAARREGREGGRRNGLRRGEDSERGTRERPNERYFMHAGAEDDGGRVDAEEGSRGGGGK